MVTMRDGLDCLWLMWQIVSHLYGIVAVIWFTVYLMSL